jgi:hypothetical protein
VTSSLRARLDARLFRRRCDSGQRQGRGEAAIEGALDGTDHRCSSKIEAWLAAGHSGFAAARMFGTVESRRTTFSANGAMEPD